MHNSPLPLLIIPYEILVREIDGAILLALEYIRRGGSCLIGQKTTLLPFPYLLPKSIWYLKSIVPGEIFVQERIRKSHGKVYSYDVEGLVPSVGEIGVRQRMNELSISRTESHFCWNQEEFNLYASVFPDYASKFVATGIPIQYAWSVAKASSSSINKRILVISSFPLICPLNSEYSRQQSKSCSGNLANQQSQFESEILMQKDGFANMQNLVSYLISRRYHITIRKHPAELTNIWQEFASSPFVNFDSSSKPIVESLLSASSVFCLNSTVSLQCKAMSIPCYQFIPNEFMSTHSSVLSQTSLRCSTVINSLCDVIPFLESVSLRSSASASTDPSPAIINRILSSKFSLHHQTTHNFILLKSFISVRRIYVLILFLLSRLPFSQYFMGPRFISPMFYRVFRAKCPVDLTASLPVCLQRLNIDASSIRALPLDRNLFLLSPPD